MSTIPTSPGAESADSSEDERLLLDAIGDGLRYRYISPSAPLLTAILNPSAGHYRFCHPDFPAARGVPTACQDNCPLCAKRWQRWLAIGVPFIDLEMRRPGILPMQIQYEVRGGVPEPRGRRGSIEHVVYEDWPGDPQAAMKFERNDRGIVIGRVVTLPPELAYPTYLADIFWGWFAKQGDDLMRGLVTKVDAADIRSDPRYKRRVASEEL